MSEAGNFRCTGEARLGTLSVLGFSGPDFSQLSSFICSREVPTHKLATKDKARETGTKAGVGGWRRECSANKGFQHNADPREVESGGWGDRRKGEGDQRVLNCSQLGVKPFCLAWHRRATIHNYMYCDFKKLRKGFSMFPQNANKTFRQEVLTQT